MSEGSYDYEILTGLHLLPQETLEQVMYYLMTSQPSPFMQALRALLEDKIRKNGYEKIARLHNLSPLFLNLLSSEVKNTAIWEECQQSCTSSESNTQRLLQEEETITPQLVCSVLQLYFQGTLDKQGIMAQCSISEELFNRWCELFEYEEEEREEDWEEFPIGFRKRLCQEYISGEIDVLGVEKWFNVSPEQLKSWFHQIVKEA